MSSEPLSLFLWKKIPDSGMATPRGSTAGEWALKASIPPGASRPRRTRSQATKRASGRWVKREVTRMASKRSAQAKSSGRIVETMPWTPKRSS